jgi:hypothetical protein
MDPSSGKQNEYQYFPLFPGEIRLLVLHPFDPFFPKRVSCHLQNVKLDEPRLAKYTAISYVWGNPTITKTIICAGKKLQVTTNLYSALKSWRTRNGNRVLWADAICIDQSNTEEKSQQVRLMKEIYSKARRVVIWLVSPNDSLAQDMDSSLTAQSSRNKTVTVKAPKLSTILHKLLCHPYWTRVWVVQEVVVARKAVIYFGGRHYKWNKFVRTARDLHTEEARTVQRKMIHLLGLKIQHLTGLEKVIRIDDMRRHSRDAQPKEETFLPMILMRFFTSQATNPIDRVFAFLGISKDIMLEADYRRLDTDIYKEVARHALRTQLPKLRFVYFSAAGLANNADADWSWVPDLRRLKIQLPFPLWDFWQYAAGGGAYSDVEFLKLDRISVEGVLIDRIRTVSKMRSESKLDNEVHAQLNQNGSIGAESAILTFFKSELPRFKEQFEMVNEGKGDADKGEKAVYALTGQTLKEAFLRTLLCDTASELLGSETSASEYGEQLVKLIKANEKSQIGIDCLRQSLGDVTQLPLQIPSSSFGRQVAVTYEGYMALVVPGVCADDYICIFSGSSTPHVLRRDGDGPSEQYRLVGDVYVHGFMDGKEFHKRTKRRFIIR